jgi:hypothetical protein
MDNARERLLALAAKFEAFVELGRKTGQFRATGYEQLARDIRAVLESRSH